MSRCFPYPPPIGYVKSCANGEALVEWIKLQSEKAMAERERKKDERRKKKEKKKKEKERLRRSWKKEPSSLQLNASGQYQKKVTEEAEQVEQSGLTEEREHPINLERFSYSYASDGTHSSSKKRRQDRASLSNKDDVTGNVIKIRIPLRHKDKEADASKQACSTSRGTDSERLQASCHGASTAMEDQRTARPDRELLPQIKAPVQIGRTACQSESREKKIRRSESRERKMRRSESREKKIRRAAALYRDLLVNWTPPYVPLEPADEQWLCGTKPLVRHAEERSEEAGDEVSWVGGGPDFQPRARLLPGTGIYALPYVIPF